MQSPINDNEVEAQRQMDSYKEFIANPLPTPPAAYRLLDMGEILQLGDEYQIADGSWRFVTSGIGSPRGNCALFRRTVKPAATIATAGIAELNPPARVRLLRTGELIQAGDECQIADGSWLPVGIASYGLPKASWATYRRAVNPAATVATTGINPKDAVGATKPPLSLVPPCFHVYVAMAMKDGAKKYGPYNWRTGKVQSMIYLDAAMRHIQSFVDGETNAKDSGQHHLAHAAACCAILLDAFLTDSVKDNRPTPGKTAELIEQFTEKKI